MARRGRLIAMEGIDGCGKSTQARLLAERLGAELTFEPGSTALGVSLRRLLLGRHEAPVSIRAEALLMAADRAQHMADVIAPALEAGRWVVTDRYSASTLAYQGFGRGLDRTGLEQLVTWATDGVGADLTILFDLSPEVAAERRRDSEQDRFEAQGLAFQERVAMGYRRMGADGVEPWLVVDGSATVEEVAAEVWFGVERCLRSWDVGA